MNVCKNNHIIENKDGELITCGCCVIHCHKCGYSTTTEKITVLYLRDEFSPSGETFHIYYLYPNLFCQACGNKQDTFAVSCWSNEKSYANYEAYKTAKPIEKGIIQ